MGTIDYILFLYILYMKKGLFILILLYILLIIPLFYIRANKMI